MKKKQNVTRERRKIIMTENNYSIFDDVTMPDWVNDEPDSRNSYFYLKCLGRVGQTRKLVESILNADNGNGSRPLLKVISKKLLTQELCLLAVQKDGRNIEYVPKKLLTNEMYSIAVQENGDTLQFVPEEKRTEEMCLTALKTSKWGRAVEYIPKVIRKGIGIKRSYELAVQYNGLALGYVPNRYITEKLVKVALQDPEKHKSPIGWNQWPIQYVPQKFLTKEILLLSLQVHPQSVEDIPKNYITPELIADYLADKNATLDIAKAIPWRLLEESTASAVLGELEKHGYKEIPKLEQENKHIEENKGSEKTLLCNGQELTYCSDSERTPVETEALTVSPLMNILAPTIKKKVETNIYYISDIHIEHNLDVVGKPYDEIEASIDDFVKKLICGHYTSQDILLVGGDISCFLSLNYMFYKSLQNYWHGKIVFVLGNHDVWNYEDTEQNKEKHLSIEEVINLIEQNYQKKSYSSKPILLENALFLRLQDTVFGSKSNNGIRLTEEKILAANPQELNAYCKKASAIILGGLGFSGKNKLFNADKGIYRYTVTRSEDIERSRRFEAVYNKLLQCAADEPVIVLTHTPMRDWSKQPYHPGWIYISGHTHQNIASLDHNGAIVLENNQFGYHGKNAQLKKFILNREKYDPLENLSDGIHIISKAEYLDYNHAHDIAVSGFARTGTVLALKKKPWYMFLLQDKDRLYILEGVRVKTATHNVRFYYENLEYYCNNVVGMFVPFFQHEKQVAELVKLAGGEGTVHGCIIDFDFYNHVFVNPIDGSLTPYYATSMTYKSVYSDFTELKSHLSGEKFMTEKVSERALTKSKRFAVSELNQYISKNEEMLDSIVYDTTIYKYSGIVKSIQYIIDKHIVRVWRDEFLKYTGADSLKGSLNSIPAAEIESYFEESEKEEK